MKKREFFDELHKKLGEKYNLTHHQVTSVRCLFIGLKKSRKEIAEWCATKLQMPRRDKIAATGKNPPYSLSRKFNKHHYQTLLNFTASCSMEAWNDITQITKFDK